MLYTIPVSVRTLDSNGPSRQTDVRTAYTGLPIRLRVPVAMAYSSEKAL
jgi:hypothetical protein